MSVTFSFPTPVLFAPGAVRELPQRLSAMGANKPLVVTDRGLLGTPAFATLEALSGKSWPVFADVTPNPTEQDVERSAEAFKAGGCDSVVAFGGGSALDVGKVLRIRVGWPDVSLRKFSPPAK